MRVLAFALLLAAQYTETTKVTVVEIPVQVTDPDGNPVRGLTKDDFELVDEGRKRAIAYFDVVDFGGAAPASSRSAGDRPEAGAATPRRQFFLILDGGLTSVQHVARAQKLAESFIDERLATNDQVAVAVYRNNSGVVWLTPLTGDRALLLAGVRELKPQHRYDGLGVEALAGSVADDTLDPAMASMMSSEAREAILGGEITQELRRDSRRYFIRLQIADLARLADDLGRHFQRPQVVFFSSGFDADLMQGEVPRRSFNSNIREISAGRTSAFQDGSGPPRVDAQLQRDMELLFEHYRRADVVLHTVDVKGLTPDGVGGTTESLTRLANDTGGVAVFRTNDFDRGMETIVKRSEVTYVLAFHLTGAADGKFHRVKVRLKNAARGAEVHHRAGYYAN